MFNGAEKDESVCPIDLDFNGIGFSPTDLSDIPSSSSHNLSHREPCIGTAYISSSHSKSALRRGSGRLAPRVPVSGSSGSCVGEREVRDSEAAPATSFGTLLATVARADTHQSLGRSQQGLVVLRGMTRYSAKHVEVCILHHSLEMLTTFCSKPERSIEYASITTENPSPDSIIAL